MATLTNDVKRLIVTELAMFSTPSEVVVKVKDEFGIAVDRRQVHCYDPLGSHGANVGKQWKALHKETRKRFLKDTASIPIANRAYRLRVLNEMASQVRTAGNVMGAATLMEQAAKECGDAYTNKQQVKHSGAVGTYEATPEQIDQELREILGGGDAAPNGD